MTAPDPQDTTNQLTPEQQALLKQVDEHLQDKDDLSDEEVEHLKALFMNT